MKLSKETSRQCVFAITGQSSAYTINLKRFHDIDENGIKPNDDKVEAFLKVKLPNNSKELNNHSSVQYNIWQNFYRSFRKKLRIGLENC